MAPNCPCGDLSIRQPRNCSFPPCPCEKCKESRDTGVPRRAAGGDTNRGESAIADGEESYFCNYVTGTLAVITGSFIITVMFWYVVTYYVVRLVVKIYNSDEKTRKIALYILGFMVFLIASTAITDKIRRCLTKGCSLTSKPKVMPKPAPKPVPRPKSLPPAPKKKPCSVAVAAKPKKLPPAPPPPRPTSLPKQKGCAAVKPCARMAAKAKPPPPVPVAKQRFTVSIVEDQSGREIYKQSKVYNVPKSAISKICNLKAYMKDTVIKN